MAAAQAYQRSPDVLAECPATSARAPAFRQDPSSCHAPRPQPQPVMRAFAKRGKVRLQLEPQAAELSAAC